MMKHCLAPALILLLLPLAACGPPPASSDGNLDRFDPANHLGNWVVINYWAQWCKPCIEEIPELNELAREHPGVTVLGVNFDGARDEALNVQVEALGIEFPLILEDPAATLGTQRPQALPTTLILNPDGELSATLTGPQTLASLRAAIDNEAEGS